VACEVATAVTRCSNTMTQFQSRKQANVAAPTQKYSRRGRCMQSRSRTRASNEATVANANALMEAVKTFHKVG
jgi:hypothetical protein